ncbi:hypothetical protein PIB30_024545 [Stylosanthes scabra]|uniref:Uncharacterized protein n=1 Tax=Stylosanthes scabra TaxID=79078 RepID=A0ABU6RAA8_9FABA|nr:hypothetical protein [Stylosanthes scabra]
MKDRDTIHKIYSGLAQLFPTSTLSQSQLRSSTITKLKAGSGGGGWTGLTKRYRYYQASVKGIRCLGTPRTGGGKGPGGVSLDGGTTGTKWLGAKGLTVRGHPRLATGGSHLGMKSHELMHRLSSHTQRLLEINLKYGFPEANVSASSKQPVPPFLVHSALPYRSYISEDLVT